MRYTFRLRFRLPEVLAIGMDLPRWNITPDRAVPEVSIRSPDEKPIKDSKNLVARGEGYAAEADAKQAGEFTRNVLTLAFSRQKIGVDFGDRAARSGFFPAGLRMLEEQTGRRVLNDVHGLMTFESDPPPAFSIPSARVTVVKKFEDLRAAIVQALQFAPAVTDRDRLAYDLFSASFFQPGPDSRFLMLMMALETLIEPMTRSSAAVRHVSRLICLTRIVRGLTQEDRSSIRSSLEWLKSESIGQAGRRLVSRLGSIDYHGKTPRKLFTECYNVRSSLVHGASPRPTTSEVGNLSASLEIMVGDLLSGPLFGS